MFPVAAHRPAYSRAEYVSDAVVHVAGLIGFAVAVPVLIGLTMGTRGDVASVAAASIYGATLIAMLLCSALYNMIKLPGWTWILRRLDHSAIFLKIAGTYTPFVAISGQGLGLLAGLWGVALAGVGLKVFSPGRFRWLALALYLGMGWAGVVAGGALLAALPGPVVALMLGGGVLYTLGVGFHLWERLPFHNTIWHVFVLAATVLFYMAVVVHVMG
jgi:hemolysin III